MRDVLEMHFRLYRWGVSLATFKMYNFIIIWGDFWASFGLVFEGHWARNIFFGPGNTGDQCMSRQLTK